MASAEGYSAGDSIQRFQRYLETVKESGMCWFESNNGQHWVAAIQRVGGVRFPKDLRSTRGLIGSKLSHIAQIIQAVETAAYRRMLVRVQLERLSFVSEMIYLTVELNFHKTIIYYSESRD